MLEAKVLKREDSESHLISGDNITSSDDPLLGEVLEALAEMCGVNRQMHNGIKPKTFPGQMQTYEAALIRLEEWNPQPRVIIEYPDIIPSLRETYSELNRYFKAKARTTRAKEKHLKSELEDYKKILPLANLSVLKNFILNSYILNGKFETLRIRRFGQSQYFGVYMPSKLATNIFSYYDQTIEVPHQKLWASLEKIFIRAKPKIGDILITYDKVNEKYQIRM